MPIFQKAAAIIVASLLVATITSCSSPRATQSPVPSISVKPALRIDSVTNGTMRFQFTPKLLQQMNQTTSPTPLYFVVHGPATEGQDASLSVPVVGGSLSYYAPGSGVSRPEARGAILSKAAGLNMYNNQGGLIVDNFEAHLGVDPYISADIDPLGKGGATVQQVPFLRLDGSTMVASGANQSMARVTLEYAKAHLTPQAVALLNKILKKAYFSRDGDFGAVTLDIHS